jgi:chromosome partitioning protein
MGQPGQPRQLEQQEQPEQRRQQGQPAFLAITNQKGGVGKTTVAINIAGALNQHGHDVLFVDLDPQGNATEGLGFVEAYDAQPPTLFDVLTDTDQRHAIDTLVKDHPEMDVVPSNIDHHHTERELTHVRRPTEQLALVLSEIAHAYDYVLVDCPPSLGYLTDNALVATQNLVIPALAESTSMRAVELLYDHVASIEQDFNITIHERALVANRVEETNEAKEMLAWFADAFDDTPRFEIRKRVALQRAHSAGASLFEADPEVDMCEAFTAIATELDAQFRFATSDPTHEAN